VLSELSAPDREAITLCDRQGMAQADFARAKGLTLSAAKFRMQRARVRLGAQMSVACQVTLDDTGWVADFVPR
jgi:RNA polymerase sigma-70 factor (ECF subfamily)